MVVAAQPDELSPNAWAEVRRVCQTLKIGLEILPERLIAREVPSDVAVEGSSISTAAAFARLGDLKLNRPYWKLKRMVDFAVALTVAILLLPLIAAVTALVLIDVGVPIVFWQQRVGRNGTPLHLYKFRTLHTLFDRATKQKREAQEPSPIGRFLRRSRLDELPQLWNVLSGDMSLIGPRPLLPVDQPDDFTIRLAVRPGVSGWAQVCGGKLISVAEKAALDEWYIRHASLWRDLRIVVRTAGMLLFTGDRRDERAITAALNEQLAGSIAEPAAACEAGAKQGPMSSLRPGSRSRRLRGRSRHKLPCSRIVMALSINAQEISLICRTQKILFGDEWDCLVRLLALVSF
ncbi:MAG: sugar transferase [Xanthobacteraceae bacterium]